MLSRLLRCLLVLASCCLASNAVAQSYIYDAGSPTYGVNIPVENGFINITNGNLHMEFPLAQHPQRGDLKLNERLVYDSHFWKIGHYSNYYWWPDNVYRDPNGHLAAGWRFVNGADTGSVTPNLVSYNQYECSGYPDQGGISTSSYTYTFSWTDPGGTSHPFSAYFTFSQGNCPDTGSPNQVIQTGTATDASGYTITVTGDDQNGPQSYSIRDNNGMQVYPQIADRYGNYWSTDSSGNLVDDRGQTPVQVSYNGNQIYYDVLRQGGGRARYTVTTVQVTPHTQFNQQGGLVREYPNGNNAVTLNAVQSIQIPDGSSYQFEYENTFGMITKVTLPTGGQITYGWQNYTDSYNNVNRWLTSRTAGSDPSSTFTPAVVSTCGSNQQNCHEKVTVHEPGGDETVYDMQLNLGAWNVNTQRFGGSASNGTLVSSTDTVYNNLPTCGASCFSPGFITSQTVTTTLADTGLKRSDTYEYANNALGLLSAKKVYDFYTGGLPSQASAQTQYTYASTGVPADLSRLAQTDGAGNNVSFTDYTYSSSSAATSNLSGHDVSKAVGQHLQAIKQWINTDGSYLTTTLSTDDAGTVLSSSDAHGTTDLGTTTYGHDGSDTFVTSTTLPTPSSGALIASGSTPDNATGVPVSATDANSQTTSYQSYDALNRVGEIDYPNGGSQTYSRSPNSIFVYTKQTSSQNATDGTLFDEFGRASRTAKANGQSSNPWYQTDTCYNSNGQVEYASVPYAGPGWSQAKTCSGTHYTYDALGRPATISNADGSTQYTYRGRATKITDVNGRQKITQIDGLSRLTAVCEVSGQSVVGASPQDCGLDIPGSGYLTTYVYDLVNHITTVTQGAQTRTFQTDSLGRPTFNTEPERGVTGYWYYYNSTGPQVVQSHPKANQGDPNSGSYITTQYDFLGRRTKVSYSDGLTKDKYFFYDYAPSFLGWSATPSNTRGRLAGSYSDWNTRNQYSYDSMGNVQTLWQCAPSLCGTANQESRPPMQFGYNLAGTLTYSSDAVTGAIGYGRSPADETTSVVNYNYSDQYNPPNLLSNVLSGPFGPLSYSFGNGLSQANLYDSLGRPQGNWVCAQAPSIACNSQAYGWYAFTKGSRVLASSDNVMGQGYSYGYDDLNRLTSVTGPANFTYTYDRWGNRANQTGSPSVSASFDPATNHSNSFGYDVAGNQTNDALHSYTYDAEGKVLAVDGGATAAYKYDAMDNRVQVQTSSATYEYLFDASNRRVSSWQVDGSASGAGREGRIWWDGSLLATRNWDGSTYFHHGDWLGTERMRTNWQGQEADRQYSAAFGDGFAQSSSDTHGAAQDNNQFAGQEYDAESGTDHATFRQYSPTAGRWMSPDPYDGSYDFSNPQSLNRYSYVNNNPFSATDPSGQIPCAATASTGIVGSTITVTCIGFSAGTAVCGPVCGVVLGSILGIATTAIEDLFFAKPAFTGSLQPRPQARDVCSQSPKAPPGADVKSNLALLQQASKGMNPATKLGFFKNVFQTNGAFDYKSLYKGPGWGDDDQFTDFGNYNYGYSCAGMYPNSGTFCQSAAGLNRAWRAIGKRLSPFKDGIPFVKKPYGDQYRDDDQIEKGMAAKAAGC